MKALPIVFAGSLVAGAGSLPSIVQGASQPTSEVRLAKAEKMCWILETGDGRQENFKLGYWWKDGSGGDCKSQKDKKYSEVFLWKGSFAGETNKENHCVKLLRKKEGQKNKYLGIEIDRPCFAILKNKGFAIKK